MFQEKKPRFSLERMITNEGEKETRFLTRSRFSLESMTTNEGEKETRFLTHFLNQLELYGENSVIFPHRSHRYDDNQPIPKQE